MLSHNSFFLGLDFNFGIHSLLTNQFDEESVVMPNLQWVEVTGTSVNAVPNTIYVTSNVSRVTVNFPASMGFGSVIGVVGKGAGGWQVRMNTGQTCQIGSAVTSSAGTLTSTNQWNNLIIACITSNTLFTSFSPVGNITLA